jgi:beta-galactosidase GanA
MPAFEKDQLQKIKNFVENGGTWVLGPLSACRTLEATSHWDACYSSELENWLGIHVRHRLPPVNVTRILDGTDTVGCSYWCDAYELHNNQKIIAKYTGGAVDGMAAVVECKIGKGTVIVMGTKPDDKWLSGFVKKLFAGQTVNSDPGVFVIERADEKNKPAGVIAVNTNKSKAKYTYNGETHLLESNGVDILPAAGK